MNELIGLDFKSWWTKLTQWHN